MSKYTVIDGEIVSLDEIATREERDSSVRCPKCGSNQVHAERRGWNLWTGAIGMHKIKLTCLKCGFRFNPGQGA